MKSYNSESKWGFALAEPHEGDFGDIFVHMNNVDQSLSGSLLSLRDGDMIEFRLEEVQGKPVAKDVTIVPQDSGAFVSQWMKGVVKSCDENSGSGYIDAPRIIGDIWFGVADLPPSMVGASTNRGVMFKLIQGADGKPKAKMINPLRGMDQWEGQERLEAVVDSLHQDGYLDEEAAVQLKKTSDPMELLGILPDLEFYKADNPSSFILGALRKIRDGGKGKRDRDDGGYGKSKGGDEWGKGYGKGYGKGWDAWGKGYGKSYGKGYDRWAPY